MQTPRDGGGRGAIGHRPFLSPMEAGRGWFGRTAPPDDFRRRRRQVKSVAGVRCSLPAEQLDRAFHKTRLRDSILLCLDKNLEKN